MRATSKTGSTMTANIEHKSTVLVTSDMVIDTYLAAKREKNKDKKKEMMENVVILSQNLNRYTPLRRSQYILQEE